MLTDIDINEKFESTFTTQVGIADLKYIQNTGTLKTLLGSCVGVLLVDPTQKIAGLLHILLPFPGDPKDTNKLKYATTGIPLLLSGKTGSTVPTERSLLETFNLEAASV